MQGRTKAALGLGAILGIGMISYSLKEANFMRQFYNWGNPTEHTEESTTNIQKSSELHKQQSTPFRLDEIAKNNALPISLRAITTRSEYQNLSQNPQKEKNHYTNRLDKILEHFQNETRPNEDIKSLLTEIARSVYLDDSSSGRDKEGRYWGNFVIPNEDFKLIFKVEYDGSAYLQFSNVEIVPPYPLDGEAGYFFRIMYDLLDNVLQSYITNLLFHRSFLSEDYTIPFAQPFNNDVLPYVLFGSLIEQGIGRIASIQPITEAPPDKDWIWLRNKALN